MPERLGERDASRDRDIQGSKAGQHWNRDPRGGRVVDVLRYPGAFRPEQQDVACLEFEIGKRRRARGRQQHDALPADLRPYVKSVPARVPPDVGTHGIIHARALERGVAERKTAGFDDVRRRAEAGGSAQDRADVAGDVGLEQGDFHGAAIKPKAPRIEGLGCIAAAG